MIEALLAVERDYNAVPANDPRAADVAAFSLAMDRIATSRGMPSIAAAQAARVLKFIPQADLTLLDPLATGGCVTRSHAMMVYDTLYGIDAVFRPPHTAAT